MDDQDGQPGTDVLLKTVVANFPGCNSCMHLASNAKQEQSLPVNGIFVVGLLLCRMLKALKVSRPFCSLGVTAVPV